jgi:hypothetical protein
MGISSRGGIKDGKAREHPDMSHFGVRSERRGDNSLNPTLRGSPAWRGEETQGIRELISVGRSRPRREIIQLVAHSA